MSDHLNRFATTANFITIGRLLLLVPLFICLRRGSAGHGNFWALFIMGLALLSDMLDGLIARLFKQESNWGRILDPVADKLWIGFLALFLAMPWREHPLPWWFLALILLRDLAIVGGASYAYWRTGAVMAANWLGKVAMVIAALTLISYTIYETTSEVFLVRPEALIWLTTLLILLSGIGYAYRLRIVLTDAERRARMARQSPPLKIRPTR